MKRLVVLAVLALTLSSAPNVLAGDTIIVIKDGRSETQQSTQASLATVVALQILNALLPI